MNRTRRQLFHTYVIEAAVTAVVVAVCLVIVVWALRWIL